MTESSSSHPKRMGYISGSEFFFYSRSKDEFGTNKRHPASTDLAKLILRGLDTYEAQRAALENVDQFPGQVVEIIDEEDKMIAIRVDDPQLIINGLKGCMDMPMMEISADQRGLAHWAAQDFDGFTAWLNAEGIRPATSGE